MSLAHVIGEYAARLTKQSLVGGLPGGFQGGFGGYMPYMNPGQRQGVTQAMTPSTIGTAGTGPSLQAPPTSLPSVGTPLTATGTGQQYAGGISGNAGLNPLARGWNTSGQTVRNQVMNQLRGMGFNRLQNIWEG